MTTLLQAIILGIIQGITEWLPVSSSGHLAIVEHIFKIQPPLLFNVMLHFGSLVVILVVFWQDIRKIALSLFSKRFRAYRKLFYFMVIGSVPLAFAGYFLHDFIAGLFTSLSAIAVALLFTGALLYLAEMQKEKKRSIAWLDSALIGVMQAVALVPGVSRSGSTISTGLILGVERKQAARFSFLLAIPAIIGATAYEGRKIGAVGDLLPSIAGTIASVIVGYFSIKWLLKIIQQKHFSWFAYYCWLLALAVFAMSLFSS